MINRAGQIKYTYCHHFSRRCKLLELNETFCHRTKTLFYRRCQQLKAAKLVVQLLIVVHYLRSNGRLWYPNV